ncbi:MAG TPA: CoA pyrophosphatase [Spirochaetia bacterium]|nr:CoA pyrophosphatase [Spirochaetales bacterium]HRY73112.1 CoA pyrophosphatase [Spirochaetia bacterium]
MRDSEKAASPGLGGLAEALREALSRPLPGRSAQDLMLPAYRLGLPEEPEGRDGWRQAAVLVLLYPGGGPPAGAGSSPGAGRLAAADPLAGAGPLLFPLIERSTEVGRHRGEVGLPGGALEADETGEEAAFREAREELGLEAEAARPALLGALSPLRVPPSGYEVRPYVALLPRRPAFRPEPAEVAELFEAPLSRLLEPEARGEEERLFGGRPFLVPFFGLGGRKVWGATAMILAELSAVLESLR